MVKKKKNFGGGPGAGGALQKSPLKPFEINEKPKTSVSPLALCPNKPPICLIRARLKFDNPFRIQPVALQPLGNFCQ